VSKGRNCKSKYARADGAADRSFQPRGPRLVSPLPVDFDCHSEERRDAKGGPKGGATPKRVPSVMAAIGEGLGVRGNVVARLWRNRLGN